MTDYDFRVLQPSEFECFSRDLLQSRENIFIESFADGRDKGVDLRFAYNKDKTCIVQCKRYKEWNELKNHLKEEVKKVHLLKPQRYILTTTVDLTVGQKDIIVELFTPYILSTSDILGRKDLNNLLELHQEIEKNYHKLWLASTNVLNLILNRTTVNWSAFELEKIEHDIRIYVENKSLNNALDILKNNHYVIISGIPGIGKTTLARMLVYTMLAQGYEEFVYITEGMDDAAKMYDKEKRQIFFYDDFLGRNSFIPQSAGFENKLITFIEKVRNSKNTLFILSTREYVLSEAKGYYEKLSMANIDIAKCTIELEYYTKTIKARILYNHLAEADIPREYIDTFLEKHIYRDIISHQNFNPRVIESIIKEQIWDTVSPDDFAVKVKEFFDNPISVWQFAFEKLDTDTRYALLVLGTMGDEVLLDDFEEAYRTFCILTRDEIGLKFDDVKWRLSLKVLMNCFVKIQTSKNIKMVSMYNPSISDFITSYLNDNHNTTKQLLYGSCFVEQLLNIFSDNKEYANKKSLVYIDEGMLKILENSFNRSWENNKTCKLKDRFWNDVEKEGFCETRILFEFMNKFPTYCNSHKGFIEGLYDRDELTWQTIKLEYRTELMTLLDWTELTPKAGEYITQIVENEPLDSDDWLIVADTIKDLDLGDEVLDKFFYDKMEEDFVSEVARFTDQSECDEQWQKMESLKELLPNWDNGNLAYAIIQAEERIKKEEETEDNDDYYRIWKEKEEKEDSQIDEMFGALRYM